jgi:polyhydroxyalkanoate synthase
MSVWADPLSFSAEPWIDWLQSSGSTHERRLHWQVRRWSLDESPMARRLYEEVEEELYRRNRFAEGELRIDGRPARAQAIEAPILAVLDRRSRIVPAPSVEAYRRRTASKDVQILEYPGDTGVMMQHVGVLVGRNAHAALWPAVASWLRLHSSPEATPS